MYQELVYRNDVLKTILTGSNYPSLQSHQPPPPPPRSFRATSLDALLPHYLGAWNRLCRFQIPGTAFRISCQTKLDCGFQSLTGFLIKCFHMTSRRPYWCSKTINRRPCWCPKPILWELNSFLMHTPSFVLINLHRC